jgi:hypothetical protein
MSHYDSPVQEHVNGSLTKTVTIAEALNIAKAEITVFKTLKQKTLALWTTFRTIGQQTSKRSGRSCTILPY